MYIGRIEKEVGQYYEEVKETVGDALNQNGRGGRSEDLIQTYKRALEEKDRLIQDLQDTSRVMQMEYENEKKRVHDKVNRLSSEIDFLEKSKAKKEAIGGYDLKAMQLKIDELQNKLEGCKHRGGGNETNTNVMKTLESINTKLDGLARQDTRQNNYSWNDKQLEVR